MADVKIAGHTLVALVSSMSTPVYNPGSATVNARIALGTLAGLNTVPASDSSEDATDYSSTPFEPPSGEAVSRSLTGAFDHIVEFQTDMVIGSWGTIDAPAANTLDLRAVVGVSINRIAGDGNALSGNVGIIPAGGFAVYRVIATNTVLFYGVTNADQAIAGALTVGGDLTLTGALAAQLDGGGFALFNFADKIEPIGSISGSVVVDASAGGIQTATLTGNVTALSFSNMSNGQSVRLDWELASFTLADPTGASWPGGSPPTLGTGLVSISVTKMTAGPTYEMFFAGGDRS